MLQFRLVGHLVGFSCAADGKSYCKVKPSGSHQVPQGHTVGLVDCLINTKKPFTFPPQSVLEVTGNAYVYCKEWTHPQTGEVKKFTNYRFEITEAKAAAAVAPAA